MLGGAGGGTVAALQIFRRNPSITYKWNTQAPEKKKKNFHSKNLLPNQARSSTRMARENFTAQLCAALVQCCDRKV